MSLSNAALPRAFEPPGTRRAPGGEVGPVRPAASGSVPRGRDGGTPAQAGWPLVSAVICTRNRVDLVARAVRSALDQTERRIEVIVVDDGSTDGTGAMLEAIGDSRLRVLGGTERCGANVRRNQGIAAARARFVALLDSDDWWTPDRVARDLARLDGPDADSTVLLCRANFVRGPRVYPDALPPKPAGRSVAEHVYRYGGALQTSGMMVPAGLARRVPFDETLAVNQDTDFLIRLEAAGATVMQSADRLYYLDVSPRADRTTLNPDVIAASRAWYRRVGRDWRGATRRGYRMFDLTRRYVASGDRRRALVTWAGAVDPRLGLRGQIRILMQIVFAAEDPGPFVWLRALRGRLARRRPGPRPEPALPGREAEAGERPR